MATWRKLHTKVTRSLDVNDMPDDQIARSLFHRRHHRQEPEMVTIYGLLDPRTDELRYIGKTHCEPIKRFYLHVSGARRGDTSPKAAWIRRLLGAGLRPKLVVLAEYPFGVWRLAERTWIETAQRQGYDLLNVARGGGGV